MRTKRYIIIAMLALTPAVLSARTIQANQYVIWGIGNDEINIPSGSILTEAVLTIKTISPRNAPLKVHLLDNTRKGIELGIDNSDIDFFNGSGTLLSGSYQGGNYICQLSQNDNPDAPIHVLFPSPASVTLADASTVQLSSSILELMDYIGNGGGFGIGIDSDGAQIQFSDIQLDLTVCSFSSQTTPRLYTFRPTWSYALQFDGVDDYLMLGYTPPANNFTVSAWVQATTTHEIDLEGSSGVEGVFNQKYLFHPNYKTDSEAGIGISVGTNGISVYELGYYYMPAVAVYSGNLGTGWNHIAVTYTNKQPRIYLNGVLVHTGLTSTRTNVYSPTRIGGGTYGSFCGKMDNITVWNQACTDQQIIAMMNADVQGTETGLIAGWLLDEGSGSRINDISANGCPGLLYGPTWAGNKANKALEFDGVDDYMMLGYTPPVNDFTISAWVKANTIHEIDPVGSSGVDGVFNQKFLFWPDYKTGSDAGVGISVGTNGISVYELGYNYMPAVAVYSGNLGTCWNHITVTYTNKQPRIYLNGVLVSTGLTSARTNLYAPTRLGGGTYGYFCGTMDNVSIWNKACSEQKIKDMKNFDIQGDEKNLVGAWLLDEGTGTLVRGISMNRYAAAIAGAAWTQQRITSATEENINSALKFDGVDDYMTLGLTAPSNNFTISAWVKATATHEIDAEGSSGVEGTSNQKYLFHPTYKAATDAGVGISVGTNGISVYELGYYYMPAVAVYSGNIGTDWNHIAVTYVDKQPRIYLNGVLVRTGLTSTKTNVYAPTRLGGGTYGSFAGTIDSITIWNQACTVGQIQDMAAEEVQGNEAGLMAGWLLDEGSGTKTFDISANGCSGFLCGPAWINL